MQPRRNIEGNRTHNVDEAGELESDEQQVLNDIEKVLGSNQKARYSMDFGMS